MEDQVVRALWDMMLAPGLVVPGFTRSNAEFVCRALDGVVLTYDFLEGTRRVQDLPPKEVRQHLEKLGARAEKTIDGVLLRHELLFPASLDVNKFATPPFERVQDDLAEPSPEVGESATPPLRVRAGPRGTLARGGRARHPALRARAGPRGNFARGG